LHVVQAELDISELHRLTPDEYHALVAEEAFGDSRVELLKGLLFDVKPRPPSPAHELTVEHLNWRLAHSLDGERFRLRPGLAASFGDSVPLPDIAVVARGTHESDNPASAALIIEVALSSRARDLTLKPTIYARAAVREYWVIDLARRVVVAHRQPAGTGYRDVSVYKQTDTLDASVVGLKPIAVAELLAPSRAHAPHR
jgi:Uma2 family endonuclease